MVNVVMPESDHTDNSCRGNNFSINHLHCDNSWMIDSGASSHVSISLSLFTSYISLSDIYVTLSNNCKIQVASIGHIVLNHDLILTNVLYIPSFSVNLISLSSLLSNSKITLTFFDTYCLIDDTQQSKVIGKGDTINGLYILSTTGLTNNIVVLFILFNLLYPYHHVIQYNPSIATFGMLGY